MIALEVSSGAGRPPYGGVGGAIRNTVSTLLRTDPETRYLLCYRFSRWRRGHLFRVDTPNCSIRVVQDPLNALLIPRARLFHSMGIYCPTTPHIPKLLTVHDLNAVRNPQWVRPSWHERRSARIREAVLRADHVVTYSAFTAREVMEEYSLPEDRVHPVALGVDTDLFRPPESAVCEELRRRYGDYVISIGLLTPRKNFANLVHAVAPLKDVNLVLVGRPTDGAAEVEAAIDETGMSERVFQLRGLPHADLIATLGAARVCAVASLYEGFGLTVLEAMACGTPVVSSDAASLPEAAGDAAVLVDARRVEALGAALRRVLDDSDLATDLRARGLERARAMSWTATAERLRRVYRDVGGV